MQYTADFETTTNPDDCRVWAWGLCEISDKQTFTYGNNIDTFFDVFRKKSAHVYFHNLKFDGEFIVSWLFNQGFNYVESREDLYTNSFTAIIADTGQWYSVTICFRREMQRSIYLTLLDSLKILPFPVESVAKAFGLSFGKLTIDYDAPREPGHVLTANEIDYLKNDVTIMAAALSVLFAQDLKSMTIGTNALKDFKRVFDVDRFNALFPVPDYDADVRKSYRGGFTYLMPKYANKTVGAGIVLDVNSLYPSVMYRYPMPYGNGLYFNGQYKHDNLYPLFIQMFTCEFKLKPKHIPTVQLKKTRYFYGAGEYLEQSDGETALTMTSVDLKLFKQHYKVWNVQYIGGYKFKASTGLFCDYIDKWLKIKTDAKTTGNKGMYTLAKLMLNSLYGKFALNPDAKRKIISFDHDANLTVLRSGPMEQRTPVYIPVGTFITSYARYVTVTAAQKLYDRFIYADTDSLHLIGTELVDCIPVDTYRLGQWKHEFTFSKAHYIRSKTYIEYGREPGDTGPEYLKVTCAGLPARCHKQVTFDNFMPGMVYTDKLLPKRVPGGVVLLQTEFKIKEL